MAKGLNRVELIGNIGQDPEKKYLSDGTVVVNFSMATAEGRKNKDGQWEEHTEWHAIRCYGKLADIVMDYTHKGSKVYIEGRLRTRTWEDDQGKKHYKTEIVCLNLLMLDAKKDGGGDEKKPAGKYQDAPQEDGDLPF